MKAKRLLQSFIIAALLCVGMSAHAQKVALLIGNANYTVGRLTNPPQDIQTMETALGNLGFKVQKVLNANQNQMKRAVRDFGSAAQGADIAFLYYSGHGTQANGENYLLPVGASIDKESDYAIEAIAANDVLQQIRGARPKAAILVLDACRDNPLAATTRSSTKGLGRMDAPTGTMIAFATAPNTVASDNGDYAKVLARELQKPGQELIDVFRNTTEEVLKRSNGKQEPRISEMSIVNRLYLAGKPPEPGPGTLIASVRPEPTGRTSPSDPEEEAWQATKSVNTAAAYDTYLAEYPSGRFASAARIARAGVTAQPFTQATAPSTVATPTIAPAVGSTFKDCADCPEMVVIPAGQGIPAMAIGQTEVTQGQWQALMGSNPSQFKACGSDCPVENVSWHNAQAFIQKLNAKTGKTYRLPTEQEWAYACLGGQQTEYCGSNNVDAVAWYDKNSGNTTQRVHTKQANGYGLYDMSGNVYEWTDGCWEGNCGQRVARGGSSNFGASNAHARSRVWFSTSYRGVVGFRLARIAP